MKKKTLYWVIGIFVVIVLANVFLGDIPEINVQENNAIDESQFNQLSIQSLYDNGFCYVEMEADGFDGCGEAEFPFIKIYNGDDFEEPGKILLVTQVTDDLYEKIPDLYNREIVFVFRDRNQQSIDRIYVKENEWSR